MPSDWMHRFDHVAKHITMSQKRSLQPHWFEQTEIVVIRKQGMWPVIVFMGRSRYCRRR
jgi:hypothetical protein